MIFIIMTRARDVLAHWFRLQCAEYVFLICVSSLVSRSSFVYLKFLLVWALVLLADFVLEFRFEYLWPFWLFIRSVYDSFRYQGLVSDIHNTLQRDREHEEYLKMYL